MGELLDGGLDLAGLAACYVAIAVIVLFAFLWARLSSVIDVNIPYINYRPFHSILTDVNTAVENGCSDAIDYLGKAADDFENGLLQSLELMIGIPAVIALGLYKALTALWSVALRGFVGSVVNPIRAEAEKALADVAALSSTVAADLGRAEAYARGQVSAAATALEAYAATAALDAEHAAERYADQAVSKLQTAEDAALNGAVTAFDAGLKAAEDATAALAAKVETELAAAATTAEREAAAAGQAALTASTAALAATDATFTAALNGVKSIAVTAEDDITAVVGKIGIPGVAALIASIPLLGTLVNTLAQETGLENQSCRSKVKGICGTDPAAWANLLAGAGFLAIALDFQEFVDAAETVAEGIGAAIGELERPFLGTAPPLALVA